jgi:hypothetical protein
LVFNLFDNRPSVSPSDFGGKKYTSSLVEESLKWETIEQTFFWKLFHAHGFKGDHWVMELLKELDFKKHPEAAMQAFEALKDSM